MVIRGRMRRRRLGRWRFDCCGCVCDVWVEGLKGRGKGGGFVGRELEVMNCNDTFSFGVVWKLVALLGENLSSSACVGVVVGGGVRSLVR